MAIVAALPRALAFSVLAALGLGLAGIGGLPLVAVSAVIFLCLALGILAGKATAAALAALLWGAFAYSGVVPTASDVPGAVSKQLAQLVPTAPAPAPQQPSALSRLEQLQAACGKGLLTVQQCEEGQATIAAELSRPAR